MDKLLQCIKDVCGINQDTAVLEDVELNLEPPAHVTASNPVEGGPELLIPLEHRQVQSKGKPEVPCLLWTLLVLLLLERLRIPGFQGQSRQRNKGRPLILLSKSKRQGGDVSGPAPTVGKSEGLDY